MANLGYDTTVLKRVCLEVTMLGKFFASALFACLFCGRADEYLVNCLQFRGHPTPREPPRCL